MKKAVFLFLSLCTLVFFLPSLASTSFGQKLALQLIGWKARARIDADSMRLSWLGPQSFTNLKVTNSKLNVSCETFTAYMSLWKFRYLQGPFTISKGSMKLSVPSCESVSIENAEASIDGREFTATGSVQRSNQTGSFQISGLIASSNYSLNLNLSSIPSCLLDHLFPTKGLIEKLLGPMLSLEGSIEAKGSSGAFDLALNSPQCQASATALFDSSTIRLQKPFSARILPSDTLTDLLMKEVNPLFLTSIQANHPILIQLSPQNFSLPYSPLDLASANIESGLIDIGQVTVENGPSLQSLLAVLKNRRLQSSRQMNAWFTPLAFQLKNGTLKADRLDVLLANSIHLCSWGRINLQNQKLHMYLGLPEDTLASSFNISGLHPDYVLKIPVRGTISHPDLITGSAIAQITALSASQNLPLPKVGKLFGKIVQTATQLKNDKDVPPAKRPFPWER